MQQSHKRKNPSKKETQDMIIKNFNSEIKKHHIKGLVQGGEVLAQTILDFINEGKDLDYVKSYCESVLKSKDTMEKVVSK